MSVAEGSASHRRLSGLTPLVAKSLVNQVVEAIVEAAAKGVFLPGDRLVEAELARSLNVSRIPVREALRLLESQGVVVSERFRGMSLMSVDIDRIEKILKVRLALEKLAGTEVMAKLRTDPKALAPLEEVLAEMHKAGTADDGFRVASLDTEFHQVLCGLSGNEVLLRTFEPLSRQLTIIFGLSTMKKSPQSIVDEHDELIEVLRGGDQAAFEAVLQVHILEYSRAIDYEHLVGQLRSLEHRRKTG